MIEVLTAGVTASGLVAVAIITGRLSGRVKSVQGQVQNDHEKNLRDEMDERHAETREWFEAQRDDIRDLRKDLGGIKADIRGIRKEQMVQSGRILTIEQEKRSR